MLTSEFSSPLKSCGFQVTAEMSLTPINGHGFPGGQRLMPFFSNSCRWWGKIAKLGDHPPTCLRQGDHWRWRIGLWTIHI